MNLGKLLAAGKSIAGGRREVSYRVNERASLPKFISPKNPFATPGKTEPTPQPAEPVKGEGAHNASKTQSPLQAIRVRMLALINRLNPVLIWRASTSRAPQKKAQPPTQAELSLDRVKVVHNDLSDADVEIVPIKSRTTQASVEAEQSPLISGSGRDSWSRLGAKIFGVKTA